MVRLALILLFGCFPGLQASTDKQELRYRFAQGQKLEITVGQKMSLKLKEIPEEFAEMIGDEPLKLDFTGTISVTVTSRKENGTAILKGKFTKASATGTVFVEDVEFEYRRCNLSGQIVTEVEFQLNESKIEEVLEKMDEIYNEKQESQPLGTFNAGSIFKNTTEYKAAELIDKANLKGVKVGGAVVSEKHANFIVNTGSATSTDILELIKIIKETIKEKYNVSLKEEIHIW